MSNTAARETRITLEGLLKRHRDRIPETITPLVNAVVPLSEHPPSVIKRGDALAISNGHGEESAEQWLARSICNDPRAISYVRLTACILAGLEPVSVLEQIAAPNEAAAAKLHAVSDVLAKLNGKTGGAKIAELHSDSTNFYNQLAAAEKITAPAEVVAQIHLRHLRTLIDCSCIGQLLINVKSGLEHGEFEAWFEAQDLPFDIRTGQNYMNAARFVLSLKPLVQEHGEAVLQKLYLGAACILGRASTPEQAIQDAVKLLKAGKAKLTSELAQELCAKYSAAGEPQQIGRAEDLEKAKNVEDLLRLCKEGSGRRLTRLRKAEKQLRDVERALTDGDLEKMDRAVVRLVRELV